MSWPEWAALIFVVLILVPEFVNHFTPFQARWMFAWYDGWVGYFWDGKKRKLYLFFIPWLGWVFERKQE